MCLADRTMLSDCSLLAPAREPRTVGVLGGMGPAAALGFMQLLLKKTADLYGVKGDQDHVDCVLEQRSSIPDRTTAILGSDEQKEACGEVLQDMARSLVSTGRVDFVVCVCNTAHYFAPYAVAGCGKVPFLDMVALTAQKASTIAPGGRVGILGTDGTVNSGLYQTALRRNNLEPYVLPAELQKVVMESIYLAKAGKCRKAAKVFACVLEHLAASGVSAAILGCTEFPLIMGALDEEEVPAGLTLIDSVDVLAEAVVETCKGDRPLPLGAMATAMVGG